MYIFLTMIQQFWFKNLKFKQRFVHIWVTYEDGLKSSYGHVVSTVDDFFNQWVSSTATPMEGVCRPLNC